MNLKSKKIQEKNKILTNTFWPEVRSNQLWVRQNASGFTTIPRILPLVIRILNSFEKGIKFDGTYLGLWCRGWDSPYIEIREPLSFAYEAGFSGVSPGSTWRKRMRKLEEWEMIKSKSIHGQDFRHVLLMNPCTALANIKDSCNDIQIPTEDWDTLLYRMHEIGDNGLEIIKQKIQDSNLSSEV